MIKLNVILPVCFLAILTLFSCKKDDLSPVFDSFTVNGVNGTGTTDFSGAHSLGTSLSIVVGVSDDSELSSYEVIEENAIVPLVNSGDLDGTTGTFTINYAVDSTELVNGTKLMPGDSARLTFLVEDTRGQSATKTYAFEILN